jgi:hypothetical protein
MPVTTSSAMHTSARVEKARTASTAWGRASAPSARPAARRREARGRSAPSQAPASTRWPASIRAAGRPTPSTAAACPAHAIAPSPTAASSPASPRSASRSATEVSRSRSRSRAASNRSTPWRTSHTVPNWLWARSRAHSRGSTRAPARPVTTVAWCASVTRPESSTRTTSPRAQRCMRASQASAVGRSLRPASSVAVTSPTSPRPAARCSQRAATPSAVTAATRSSAPRGHLRHAVICE